MLIAAGEPQIATRLALAMLALVLGAATVSHATGLQAEQVHERPDEVWRA